jgi:hypothetical protein
MQNVKEQKVKLEQKKNRLIAEETRLKLKERKMRTRHLIEVGGLVSKAGLDHLPVSTLYGALLSAAQSSRTDQTIKDRWTEIGETQLDQERKSRQAVILKFEQEMDSGIRKIIRNHGLKWNKLRSEWYGYCSDINFLKNDLGTALYQIEELQI